MIHLTKQWLLCSADDGGNDKNKSRWVSLVFSSLFADVGRSRRGGKRPLPSWVGFFFDKNLPVEKIAIFLSLSLPKEERRSVITDVRRFVVVVVVAVGGKGRQSDVFMITPHQSGKTSNKKNLINLTAKLFANFGLHIMLYASEVVSEILILHICFSIFLPQCSFEFWKQEKLPASPPPSPSCVGFDFTLTLARAQSTKRSADSSGKERRE